jgi:hypothetical protein
MTSPSVVQASRVGSIAITLALYVGGGAGCAGRQPPPAAALARSDIRAARLTLADSRIVTLSSPSLVGDSVVGRLEGMTPPGRVGIPVSSIRTVEVMHPSAGRGRKALDTVLKIAVAAGVVVFAAILILPYLIET